MDSQSPTKSPIPSVSASLCLVAFGLQPQAVTADLGIAPSHTSLGPLRRCGTDREEECGLWEYDSAGQITSDDLPEHIEHLLGRFLPLKSRIKDARPRPNVFVTLRFVPATCEIPLVFSQRIQPVHVAGIADLGATLQFELIVARIQ